MYVCMYVCVRVHLDVSLVGGALAARGVDAERAALALGRQRAARRHARAAARVHGQPARLAHHALPRQTDLRASHDICYLFNIYIITSFFFPNWR